VTARFEAGIERLLTETAAAHHDAFRESDGVDPEWPLWYATYLVERLPAVSNFMGTRSELVFWLVRLADEYQATDSSIPWTRFYAVRLAAL
jgi:hypothetical protein